MSPLDQTNIDDVGDWTPVKFHQEGALVLNKLESWFSDLRSVPVRPAARQPAEVLADFAGPAPEEPESFTEVVEDTFDRVFKGSVHWNHPRHHAYFSHSSSGPAILAETVTAALDTNVMVWDAAPAPAAVENQVLRWLADLAGIEWHDPDAVLTSGASQSTLTALAAARERVCDHDFRTHGASSGPVLRIYCSDQTHSSIDKAAITLGIGLSNVIRVSDANGLLDPRALEQQIEQDRAHGFTPLAVVATVGTTSTAAIEPVAELAAVTGRHGLWLHVDAAYGGLWRASTLAAAAIPSFADADSVVVNPHKVLFCPLEVSALYSRHPGALVSAFSLVPEYLRTNIDDARLDYMNYSTQLGRQFRALKVWWVIRCFGTRGIASRMDDSIELSQRLKTVIAEDSVWEVVAPTPLPLLCIQPRASVGSETEADELCRYVHHQINADGRSAVSHTRVDGRYVIRISIGNIHTQWGDLEELWQQICAVTASTLARSTAL